MELTSKHLFLVFFFFFFERPKEKNSRCGKRQQFYLTFCFALFESEALVSNFHYHNHSTINNSLTHFFRLINYSEFSSSFFIHKSDENFSLDSKSFFVGSTTTKIVFFFFRMNKIMNGITFKLFQKRKWELFFSIWNCVSRSLSSRVISIHSKKKESLIVLTIRNMSFVLFFQDRRRSRKRMWSGDVHIVFLDICCSRWIPPPQLSKNTWDQYENTC